MNNYNLFVYIIPGYKLLLWMWLTGLWLRRIGWLMLSQQLLKSCMHTKYVNAF